MTEIIRLPEFAKKGLNTDLLPWDLDGNFITHISNMRLLNGNLSPTGGNKLWSTLPQDSIPGFLIHVGSTSEKMWVIPGLNIVYAYNGNPSDIYADISSAIGYSGIVNQDLWNGCVLSDIVVINNEEHYPEYWPLPSYGTILEPLPWDESNSWQQQGERCRIIRSHKQFLFALGCTVNGQFVLDAVRWSEPADVGIVPRSWDHLDITGTAGLVRLGGPGGRIIDGYTLRDSFVVYRETSISVFDFIGGEFVFNIRHLSTSVGNVAPNCIVEVNGLHYILTDTGVYTNDGNNLVSLMYKRILTLFLSTMSTNSFLNSYTILNTGLFEIWFCIPNVDSFYPDKAFIYNWKEDAWTVRHIPLDPIEGEINANPLVYAAAGAVKTPPINWSGSSGLWANATAAWGRQNLSPLGTKLIGITRDKAALSDFGVGPIPAETFIPNPPYLSPSGIHFRPDGLKMFICGDAQDSVNAYSLTVPFDVSTAVFLAEEFRESFGVRDVTMTADGLTMYLVISDPEGPPVPGVHGKFRQYSLGVAFDLTTVAFVRDAVVISGGGMVVNPLSVTVTALGERIVIGGYTDTNPLRAVLDQFRMQTPENLSTLIHEDSIAILNAVFDTVTQGVAFSSDGLTFYATTNTQPGTYQATCPIAFDIRGLTIIDLKGDPNIDIIAHALFVNPNNGNLIIMVDDTVTASPAREYLQAYGVFNVVVGQPGQLLFLDPLDEGIDIDTAYESVVERIGFALAGLDRVTTIIRMYPHIQGTTPLFIELGSQDFPGALTRWKPGVFFNPGTDRKVDIRTTGELHCFRITSFDTTAEWKLSGVDFEYDIAGTR